MTKVTIHARTFHFVSHCVYIAGCLLSVGLIPIFMRFYPHIKHKLLLIKANLSTCTHLLLEEEQNADDEEECDSHSRVTQILTGKSKKTTNFTLIPIQSINFNNNKKSNNDQIKSSKYLEETASDISFLLTKKKTLRYCVINYTRFFFHPEKGKFVHFKEIVKEIMKTREDEEFIATINILNQNVQDIEKSVKHEDSQKISQKRHIKTQQTLQFDFTEKIFKSQLNPLTSSLIYGPNSVHPPIKSRFRIVISHITSNFSIYICICLFIWSQIDYMTYALLLLVMSSFTIIGDILSDLRSRSNLIEISSADDNPKESQEKGKDSEIKTKQFILNRQMLPVKVKIPNIYPNDIIIIRKGEVPADILLLNCTVLVDESFLTGECVPVERRENETIRAGTIVVEICNVEAVSVEITGYYSDDESFDTFSDKMQSRNPDKTTQSDSDLDSFISDLISSPSGKSKKPADLRKVPVGKVLNTSFNTTKGILVRSLMNSPRKSSIFIRSAIRIIVFSFFFGTALSFCVLLIILFRKVSIEKSFYYAVDLIITIITPALPATVYIGMNMAVKRMKAFGLVCNNISRVTAIAGTNRAVFDKTGTLTEEGLDVFEVYNFDLYRESDQVLQQLNHSRSLLMHFAMSSCHTLKILNGELQGDPLDVKMFEFTNSKLINNNCVESISLNDENSDHNSRNFNDPIPDDTFSLNIIQTLPFDSNRRRQSTFVQIGDSLFIFTKGSPESIFDILDPEEKNKYAQIYDQKSREYALRGLRVISIAYKEIALPQGTNISKDSVAKIKSLAHLSIDQENDLSVLGFLVFANSLKPETKKVIDVLSGSGYKSYMATGDNILTAISVGRECKIIKDVVVVPYGEADALEWYVIEDASEKQDEDSFEANSRNFDSERKFSQSHEDYEKSLNNSVDLNDNLQNSNNNSVDSKDYPGKNLKILSPDESEDEHKELYDTSHQEEQTAEMGYQFDPVRKKCFFGTEEVEYTIAIEGKEFSQIFSSHSYGIDDLQKLILSKCCIYARMTPDDKKLLVSLLPGIFVGDGANDVGALQQSRIGLAISANHCTLNSSFITSSDNLSLLLVLIQQGRQVLITSFTTFKFTLYASLLQFFSFCLMTINIVFVSESGTMHYDVLIVIFFAWIISRSTSKRNEIKISHQSETISSESNSKQFTEKDFTQSQSKNSSDEFHRDEENCQRFDSRNEHKNTNVYFRDLQNNSSDNKNNDISDPNNNILDSNDNDIANHCDSDPINSCKPIYHFKKDKFDYKSYDVLSRPFLISFFGHLLIDVSTIFAVTLLTRTNTDSSAIKEIKYDTGCSTVLFFLNCIQIVTKGVLFSNRKFLLGLIGMSTIVVIFTIYFVHFKVNSNALTTKIIEDWYVLVDLEHTEWIVLGVSVLINFVLSVLWEQIRF